MNDTKIYFPKLSTTAIFLADQMTWYYCEHREEKEWISYAEYGRHFNIVGYWFYRSKATVIQCDDSFKYKVEHVVSLEGAKTIKPPTLCDNIKEALYVMEVYHKCTPYIERLCSEEEDKKLYERISKILPPQ